MNKVKVAINGFGRIGRNAAKVLLKHPNLELVEVNDPADKETLRYLFAHDSTFGNYKGDVSLESDTLVIDGKKIKLTGHTKPEDTRFEADVVLECSGRYTSFDALNAYVKNGAKKVVLSAPGDADVPMFVLGVNHKEYNNESIISNGSCTTNCIAPLCKVIDDALGIESGNMITIHSYTNDQMLIDSPHRKEIRRSRAAAANMIPTTTGAAKSIYRVIPSLKGKIHGHSIRIPTMNVSMLDLNLNVKKSASASEINSLLENAAKDQLKGILRIDSDYGVSSDFLGDTHSSIVADDMTFVIGNLVKIMAWYDNEFGYANRLIEMAAWICDAN